LEVIEQINGEFVQGIIDSFFATNTKRCIAYNAECICLFSGRIRLTLVDIHD